MMILRLGQFQVADFAGQAFYHQCQTQVRKNPRLRYGFNQLMEAVSQFSKNEIETYQGVQNRLEQFVKKVIPDDEIEKLENAWEKIYLSTERVQWENANNVEVLDMPHSMQALPRDLSNQVQSVTDLWQNLLAFEKPIVEAMQLEPDKYLLYRNWRIGVATLQQQIDYSKNVSHPFISGLQFKKKYPNYFEVLNR